MRKMKKLLAAVLSAATVFSMSAMPAFADDATGSTTPVNGVHFTKEFKSDTDGSYLPDETFNFTITGTEPTTSETTYEGLTVKKGLTLASGTDAEGKVYDYNKVSLEYGTDHATSQEGIFEFTGTDFDGPAYYKYTVKEVPGENSTITYDTTEYTVYVLVDNTKTPVAVLNMSGTDKKEPIKFNNTCTADNLKITKEVKGTWANLDKKFKFQIVIPVGGEAIDLPENAEISATYERTKTYTDDPTSETFVVKNEADLASTENVFYLRNGESLVIKGLPTGMIYKIKEIDEENDQYTTTITGTTQVTTVDDEGYTTTKTRDYVTSGKDYDSTAVKLADGSVVKTPIVKGGNFVKFTNEKIYTAPTGLALKVGQQLIVLLIAVFGAVVIFKTRRRSSAK
jgi:pilin isopeptide linkage protein